MPNELLCVRADTYRAGSGKSVDTAQHYLLRLLREHRAISKRTEKMFQIYRDYKNKGDFCHGSHDF